MTAYSRRILYGLTALLLAGLMPHAIAGPKTPPEPVLTEKGKALKAKYESMLAKLKEQVKAALPAVDEEKKKAFMAAHNVIAGLNRPGGKEPDPEAVKEYKEKREAADEAVLAAARPLLKDLDTFLASEKLDAALIRIAVLTDATPGGLAEFAQLGKEEEALVEALLADDKLMKEMLIAGGPSGGEWGESMQTFRAMQAKSEHARKPGILRRLALGTALQQPWMNGKEKGGVYGVVRADSTTPDNISRYLHYEKAYLAGELDPAVKDMNVWECRFITNDPYTDEELAWTREMMRTYRPDHITNPDYKWRYVRIVKSDVPYCSPDWRPDEGTTKVQQIVAGGGKCGPRAFFGRTAARAFGIPSRRSTQTGHAAMNHWTPDGWVVCFGAWWSMNWCGPQGGLDFLLESQAREYEDVFIKFLRATWIGDALDEADVSIRYYGKGGGFWNALGFYRKVATVEDAKIEALELAGGMKLGESDELLGDEKGQEIEVPDDAKKITVDKNGVITVPAVACVKPVTSNDRIFFMKSLSDDLLIHYSRLGKRPELIKYYIEAPKAGDYELTAKVVTVARNQSSLLRLNRRTLIDLPLPFTLGKLQETEPVKLTLKEGKNTLMFTCKSPNRGVTLKQFILKPVK